jgi:hypothetical protein
MHAPWRLLCDRTLYRIYAKDLIQTDIKCRYPDHLCIISHSSYDSDVAPANLVHIRTRGLYAKRLLAIRGFELGPLTDKIYLPHTLPSLKMPACANAHRN